MKKTFKKMIKKVLSFVGLNPRKCKIFLKQFLKFFGIYPKILHVTDGVGFFSCCSLRLNSIIFDYYNIYKVTPKRVDSSNSFLNFQFYPGKDIVMEYFKYNDDININLTSPISLSCPGPWRRYINNAQFSEYKKLDFSSLTPFVYKYFSPSDSIAEIISNLENKYSLDYNNICVLFYRGNDKSTETNSPKYDDFIKRGREVKKNNPEIKFLIQSDESEFLEVMKTEFPNAIIFKDEIVSINSSENNVINLKSGSTDGLSVEQNRKKQNFNYLKIFLSITIIISKCKHIICTSGNCSMWFVLYRGNAINIQQYLSHKEYVYGKKNPAFDPNQKVFWF